ncbi:MAG: SBBP repeat-containing protein [bacterium]
MKKLFLTLLVLTLFFAVSCGKGEKTVKDDEFNDENGNLEEIDDGDSASDDGDSGDSASDDDDSGDSGNSGNSGNSGDENAKKSDLGENCTKTDDCLGDLKCVDFVCVKDKDVNEDGSCESGYKKEGSKCVDIDECEEGTHNCHEFADCINTRGGFECACRDNYIGDGVDCTPSYIREEQECMYLPENALWNTADKITQHWDGLKWVPSTVGELNLEPSTTECRYKCVKEFVSWDNLNCESMFKQWGTEKYDSIYSIARDSLGNIYAAGYTAGSIGDFTNLGKDDLFLTKIGSNGNILWHLQWGTQKNDYARSIVVDSSDNIYVAGTTEDAFPGFGNKGKKDLFLSKIDSDGNRLWTKQWGTDEDDQVRSFQIDGSGDLFIVGSTVGAFDKNTNIGEGDIFLTKLNDKGETIWTKQWGTPDYDEGRAIFIDKDGTIYVGGTTYENLGGSSSGEADLFISKLSDKGEVIWTKQWGTAEFDSLNGMAFDGFGNIFATGNTTGSFPDFSNEGGWDIFLSKFKIDGTHLWTKQWGTGQNDLSSTILADKSGNIFLVGRTDGSLNESANEGGVFLTKLNNDGAFIWTEQWGSKGAYAGPMLMDDLGTIFIGGYTSDNDALLIKFVE